jgi:hypothetical protein
MSNRSFFKRKVLEDLERPAKRFASLIEYTPENVQMNECSSEIVPLIECPSEIVPIIECSSEIVPLLECPSEIVPFIECSSEIVPLIECLSEIVPLIEDPSESVPLIECSSESVPLRVGYSEDFSAASVVSSLNEARSEVTVQVSSLRSESRSVVSSSPSAESGSVDRSSLCSEWGSVVSSSLSSESGSVVESSLSPESESASVVSSSNESRSEVTVQVRLLSSQSRSVVSSSPSSESGSVDRSSLCSESGSVVSSSSSSESWSVVSSFEGGSDSSSEAHFDRSKVDSCSTSKIFPSTQVYWSKVNENDFDRCSDVKQVHIELDCGISRVTNRVNLADVGIAEVRREATTSLRVKSDVRSEDIDEHLSPESEFLEEGGCSQSSDNLSSPKEDLLRKYEAESLDPLLYQLIHSEGIRQGPGSEVHYSVGPQNSLFNLVNEDKYNEDNVREDKSSSPLISSATSFIQFAEFMDSPTKSEVGPLGQSDYIDEVDGLGPLPPSSYSAGVASEICRSMFSDAMSNEGSGFLQVKDRGSALNSLVHSSEPEIIQYADFIDSPLENGVCVSSYRDAGKCRHQERGSETIHSTSELNFLSRSEEKKADVCRSREGVDSDGLLEPLLYQVILGEWLRSRSTSQQHHVDMRFSVRSANHQYDLSDSGVNGCTFNTDNSYAHMHSSASPFIPYAEFMDSSSESESEQVVAGQLHHELQPIKSSFPYIPSFHSVRDIDSPSFSHSIVSPCSTARRKRPFSEVDESGLDSSDTTRKKQRLCNSPTEFGYFECDDKPATDYIHALCLDEYYEFFKGIAGNEAELESSLSVGSSSVGRAGIPECTDLSHSNEDALSSDLSESSQSVVPEDCIDNSYSSQSGVSEDCSDVSGSSQSGVSEDCPDISDSSQSGVSEYCYDITGSSQSRASEDCPDISNSSQSRVSEDCSDNSGSSQSRVSEDCFDISDSSQSKASEDCSDNSGSVSGDCSNPSDSSWSVLAGDCSDISKSDISRSFSSTILKPGTDGDGLVHSFGAIEPTRTRLKRPLTIIEDECEDFLLGVSSQEVGNIYSKLSGSQPKKRRVETNITTSDLVEVSLPILEDKSDLDCAGSNGSMKDEVFYTPESVFTEPLITGSSSRGIRSCMRVTREPSLKRVSFSSMVKVVDSSGTVRELGRLEFMMRKGRPSRPIKFRPILDTINEDKDFDVSSSEQVSQNAASQTAFSATMLS